MSEIKVGDKIYRHPDWHNYWWTSRVNPPDSPVTVVEIKKDKRLRFKTLDGDEYGSDIGKFYKKDKYEERIKRLKSV